MSKRRSRRRASSTARKRRLEAAVQAVQHKWGPRALRKGRPSTAASSIPRLPTGLAQLDQILAAGLPLGHITELIGQLTSGKRTLALHILAQTQPRHPCLYIDLAQTFDPAYAAACHVDLSRLAIAAPASPTRALDLACDLAAGGHFGLVVFDSTAELLGEALPPGAAAAVLRRLRQALSGQHSALLFLTTPLFPGDLQPAEFDESRWAATYPPGFDLAQAASLRLLVSRQRWLHQSGHLRGYDALVTVLRNRWGESGQQAGVEIRFNGVQIKGV